MSNGNIPVDTERKPKYIELSDINLQLSDIRQHIIDLNMELGVKPSTICPSSDNVKVQEPLELNSLVNVLDQLPAMVNDQVSQIHHLLSDLQNNLT